MSNPIFRPPTSSATASNGLTLTTESSGKYCTRTRSAILNAVLPPLEVSNATPEANKLLASSSRATVHSYLRPCRPVPALVRLVEGLAEQSDLLGAEARAQVELLQDHEAEPAGATAEQARVRVSRVMLLYGSCDRV